MKETISDWVDAHHDEIVTETQAILRIPSVKDEETVSEGAPFGAACADALRHTLALCQRYGMRVANFDGYIGHAEFGPEDAPEYVAMLGHLDVVPAGNDWSVEPFGAVIQDGQIWARGSSDDKGPTYAALFGAKALLDSGVPLRRRVRLIFGCDEESGWDCTRHYFETLKMPQPALAFTPDAYFPLVHAEKGSFTLVATRRVSGSGLASFEAGLRPNMVPDRAVATLKTGETLTKIGKSAHGSTPQEGINAAVLLAEELAPQLPSDAEWLLDLARRAAPDGSENEVGVADDVTGSLTSNLGVVRFDGATVSATFNIRYPATLEGGELIARMTTSLAATGWEVPETPPHTPPLYVPLDQEPVKSLLRVYREHTGDLSDPLTMGGRTYATVVQPVGVAFGAIRMGEPELAHQADERFPVARLIECAKIYGHALYELAR